MPKTLRIIKNQALKSPSIGTSLEYFNFIYSLSTLVLFFHLLYFFMYFKLYELLLLFCKVSIHLYLLISLHFHVFIWDYFHSSWRTIFHLHFWKTKQNKNQKPFHWVWNSILAVICPPPILPPWNLKDAMWLSYISYCLVAIRIFFLFLVLSSFTLIVLDWIFITLTLLGFHRASLVSRFMWFCLKILSCCFSLTLFSFLQAVGNRKLIYYCYLTNYHRLSVFK